MSEVVEREAMEYDVVIVGAGPSGLAAAIRLKQLAAEAGNEITVAVLEKGSEVGAHILSGAVIDPKGISELFPDWKAMGAPLETPVSDDRWLLLGPAGSLQLPTFAMPPLTHNHGTYIASLGNVCRWMAEQAEALGVEVYPGMAASEAVFDESGALKGVVAGVFGIQKDGSQGPDYQPGIELHGKYVFIGEGVRGSLSKQLRAKFSLGEGADPEKYGIGLKELWQVPDDVFRPGLVQHAAGWPLDDKTGGGGFLYHFGDHYVSVGYVVHLNYKNPWLSPFDEFQRYKTHPDIAKHLKGGKRIAYGARAISEGGLQSVPRLYFPGGALLGDSAGFVNVPRIKGSHNAMKSGMMAAEAAYAAIQAGRSRDDLVEYEADPDEVRHRPWRHAEHDRHVVHQPAGRLLAIRHSAPRQERRGFHRPGQGLQADLVPQARRRPQLRQAVERLPFQYQPRREPTGPSDAARRLGAGRDQPAEIRRAGAALLSRRRL